MTIVLGGRSLSGPGLAEVNRLKASAKAGDSDGA